jgi:cytochrome c oxidase accessory protein FixG
MAWIWIGMLTFTTYTLAGFMREQVCVYMCPWPRIQAALTDEHALNVTYRYDRGEPRVSLKKSESLRQQGGVAGDCIDCAQCVAVCPTGIDIRDGLQIDCIQCGLCIDACDTVMAKIGRPERLIAYDTDVNIRARQRGEKETFSLIRPRTILYAAIIALVSGIMIYALATRSESGISVIHDRNPQFVILADGATRNAYTVRVLNKSLEERNFVVTVTGLPGIQVDVVGSTARQGADPVVTVGPDRTQELRMLVTLHGKAPSPSVPLDFTLTDTASGVTASAHDFFRSAP